MKKQENKVFPSKGDPLGQRDSVGESISHGDSIGASGNVFTC